MPGEQQNCNPDQPSKNANTRHGLLGSASKQFTRPVENPYEKQGLGFFTGDFRSAAVKVFDTPKRWQPGMADRKGPSTIGLLLLQAGWPPIGWGQRRSNRRHSPLFT